VNSSPVSSLSFSSCSESHPIPNSSHHTRSGWYTPPTFDPLAWFHRPAPQIVDGEREAREVLRVERGARGEEEEALGVGEGGLGGSAPEACMPRRRVFWEKATAAGNSLLDSALRSTSIPRCRTAAATRVSVLTSLSLRPGQRRPRAAPWSGASSSPLLGRHPCRRRPRAAAPWPEAPSSRLAPGRRLPRAHVLTGGALEPRPGQRLPRARGLADASSSSQPG
jgi:hypothetical protein